MVNSECICIGVGDDWIEGIFFSFWVKVFGVFFVYGWGGSQQCDLKCVQGIVGFGCVCLIFDLCGYGVESGCQVLVMCEDNLQDLFVVYDWLVVYLVIDSEVIVVVGISYGGYLVVIFSQLCVVCWLVLWVLVIYCDEGWLMFKLLFDCEDFSEYCSSLILVVSN